MNIWFTSDTHLGHEKLTTIRGYTSSVEVAEVMLTNFNSQLKRGDVLYHLGDIGWPRYPLGEWFSRLTTRNIHVVWGNHDDDIRKRKKLSFVSNGDLKYIKIEGHKIMLCHYPMASWRHSNHGGFHLHGHCHGGMAGVGRRMDVGVDTNNLMLYNWEDIKQKLLAIPLHVNQHNEEPSITSQTV